MNILDKIRDNVKEEQQYRRPPTNRVIKQASKVRLVEPTQSVNSTQGTSSTPSINMDPQPQRQKEGKKQDASRMEKRQSETSVATLFEKQKEISSGED